MTRALNMGLLLPDDDVPVAGEGLRFVAGAPFNTDWFGFAPIASPAFTGTPVAPTPAPSDNSTRLATTAFVINAVTGSVSGVASWNGRTGVVTMTNADVVAVLQPAATLPLMDGVADAGTAATWSRSNHVHPADTSKANLASPVFTGTPSAPTPPAADNGTALATTAFVKGQGFAPLANPVFTGDPQAPTPSPADNDNSIATTAFVKTAVAAGGPAASTANPLMDGAAAPGVAVTYARGDHVHPSDTTRAPVNNPVFTGDPQAPTPATADNDTSIATTAFVKNQGYVTSSGVTAVSGVAPVVSSGGATPAISMAAASGSTNGYLTSADWGVFNGKADLASPTFTGIPAAPTAAPGTATTQIATTGFVAAVGTSKANLASPVFTGDPQAPTPAPGDNDTSIATTAFVTAAIATVGGVSPSNAAPAMDGVAAAGTSAFYARGDHVHPSDTSRAPLVSPALTGTPTAPTAAAATSTTQIATTEFATLADNAVKAALIGSASTGMDTMGEIENYILANVNPAIGNKADIFSPTFTGDPKAPTPATSDNDTSIATTAYVQANLSAIDCGTY